MQKITLGFTIILLAVGLSGCGGYKISVPFHDTTLKVDVETTYSPELNKESTAEIGSNMFERKQLYLGNEYTVSIDQAVKTSGAFTTGSFYTTKKALGLLQKDLKTQWKCACTYSEISPFHKVCLYDSNNDSKFDKAAALVNSNYGNLKPPVAYKLKRVVRDAESLKYIVLYQGRKGNTINISYREFIKDMARPSFTQDVSYELKPSGITTIGFKGLRIEVIKASNFNITYRVVKDYN